jgi:phospholipase/lecithinase/hemolysin
MQSLAACTSYGVGGARINPSGAALDLTPISIVQQLKELGAASPYGTDELLLADGGGNDVADLVTAYLGMTTDAGAAYTTLLAELLGWTRVSALAAGGGTALAAGGGEYMVALANSFADALTTQALDKGAQRVLVVNMPNVVRTPRFQHVLAGVAAASGGGATGAAASAQVAALVDGWVQAFNAQLKSRFATNGKVVVVDFHAELNKWLDTPSAYGLTNTTTPACPATGTDASGLPAYNIATCTATALSASQLTLGPDWWKTYVFSDNFQGTPRTNQLMGDLVVKALETKGWK